jgi:solute carrier family 35 protein
MWLGLWYLAFLFDTVYIKHVCNTIPMTDWGRVYYTNLLSLLPLLPAWLALREYELLQHTDWSVPTITILAVSCLVGLCMSHAAYMLRRVVSATAMALVGIVCKVLTVIINFLIWDKHASLEGIGCLLVCVMAGAAYEQAPMRAAAPAPAPAPAAAADSNAPASVVDAKAIVLESLKGDVSMPGAASYRVTASGRATNTGTSSAV